MAEALALATSKGRLIFCTVAGRLTHLAPSFTLVVLDNKVVGRISIGGRDEPASSTLGAQSKKGAKISD